MPLHRRHLITAALPLAAGCAGAPPNPAPNPAPNPSPAGIDPALQARLAEAGSDGSNTHAVLVQGSVAADRERCERDACVE